MNDRIPPLSPRLAAIAEAIRPGSRVVDVGTDHGLLPLWLAATGRAAWCLATERTRALLDRASRPPAGAPWTARIAYRSGDGLAAVEPADRVDTIVIAGLGARTTVRLLGGRAAREVGAERLVLQPRTEADSLRRWLSAGGWRLAAERLTPERGRFHVTMTAVRGDDAGLYEHPELDRDDLLAAGPWLVRSGEPAVRALWRGEAARLRELAPTGASPAARRARARLARAERVLAVISRRGG